MRRKQPHLIQRSMESTLVFEIMERWVSRPGRLTGQRFNFVESGVGREGVRKEKESCCHRQRDPHGMMQFIIQ